MRVVFDTNTVISALLFRNGQLSWLRNHWQQQSVTALISSDTAAEVIRVLSYPKFKLTRPEIDCLLAEYIPFTEAAEVIPLNHSPQCTDKHDQMFIDLAITGGANFIVTGDKALLETELQLKIMRPAEYKALMAK